MAPALRHWVKLWDLFDVDGIGLQEIQKDDDGPLVTDRDALALARIQARRGAREAIRCLAIHQHDKAALRAYRRGKLP